MPNMCVSIEAIDGISLVILNNPPVNALSQPMRQGIWDAVATTEQDNSTNAVILIATGRTFVAGADIKEFNQPHREPQLPSLITKIEQAGKPWIAAVHGTVLGGGLELALGCHYRLALTTTRLGLPEVNLGLIPGAGGTVRLPRLIDIDAAIEMITHGKPISAQRAFDLRLVDHTTEGDLKAQAVAFAKGMASKPLPKPLSQRPPISGSEQVDWQDHENAVLRNARGAVAPVKALACLRNALEMSADKALALERQTFSDLRRSDQSRALRHLFFAERAAMKPPEMKQVQPRPLVTTAVIGGGTMGVGIAVALRNAGFPVTVVERDDEALEKGRAKLRAIFDALLKRARIDATEHEARLQAVQYTTDYGQLGSCDLVIEAVFEDLAVKQSVFERLEASTRPDTILATNTSYLDPNAIASVTQHPERVIALHFFSPAHVMRLLEIVPTAITADDVAATGFALAKKLNKIPVLAGICDGFIGNRLLKTTRAQAEKLLLAGSTPAEVDRAMQAFGLPMGPFAAQDLGGLDIAAFQRKAAKQRGEATFAPIAERLCAINRLGQKTQGGWYDYQEGSRTAEPSNTVARIIKEETTNVPQQMDLTDQQRADWILLPMINEATKILEEGIAKRPVDIDLVEVHGYGFPRWRGGLMHHAETVGLAAVVGQLEKLADLGVSEAPCEYLRQAAVSGHF